MSIFYTVKLFVYFRDIVSYICFIYYILLH